MGSTKHTVYLLFSLCLFAALSHGEISPGTRQMVENWSPLLWLHPEEAFLPTNFDYYIQNNELRDNDENVIQTNLTAETLLTGEQTKDYHLNTFEDIECVNCFRPHFFGQPPEQVKVYALVKEWKDSCNTVDVSFLTYYAFNYGKDVCLGAEVDGFCLGLTKTFGHHIGDGDHSTMRFQNGMPTLLKASVHTFGALYAYDNSTETFEFVEGEDLEVGGASFPVDYPETVHLVDQTHPEIFVSNGSHGNWGSPGKHTYLHLVIHLDDFCERGIAWRLWENMELIDVDTSEDQMPDYLNWTKYQGRIGNQQKLGCELESVSGMCGLDKSSGNPYSPSRPSSPFDKPPVCK